MLHPRMAGSQILTPRTTGLFLPASELKSVRRSASEALLEVRRKKASINAISPHSQALSPTAQLRRQHLIGSGVAEGPVLPGLLASASEHPVPSRPLTSSLDSGKRHLSAASSSTSSPVEGAAPHSPSGKRRSALSVSTGAQDILDRGGLRVLCRSRAQVEAASAVPWL